MQNNIVYNNVNIYKLIYPKNWAQKAVVVNKLKGFLL